ncbi:MAG: ATP-binding protein [Planctomycetota bacterium]|jgi:hypothetical protein
MGKKTDKVQRIRREAARFCREKVRPFRKNADLFEASRILFELRAQIRNTEGKVSKKTFESLEGRVSKHLHDAISRSRSKCQIQKAFRKYRLNTIEREILLLLAASALGMAPDAVGQPGSIREVQEAMNRTGSNGLEILQALSETSRLVLSGLVLIQSDVAPLDTKVIISPGFVRTIIPEGKNSSGAWAVETYNGLLDRVCGILKHFRYRSDEIQDLQMGNYSDISWVNYQIRISMRILMNTLERNPTWPLGKVLRSLKTDEERQVIVMLVARALGIMPGSHELFTAEGIARAVSVGVAGIRRNLEILDERKALRRKGFLRVVGAANLDSDSEGEAFGACEFELTVRCLKRLRIKKRARKSGIARAPLMKMDRLVFPDGMKSRLDLAIAQVRHCETLLDNWGLGDIVPYGRAVTLLFSGPPGVGKTATAEAIAHELGKKLIVANYAEIASCWAGETEKNVVRLFREAAQSDTVLFWDEADSMFYNRDTAFHNYEVRVVNLLLQELEKFDGLCILSTNRKIVLDKALERRISIKVDFEAPDKDMSRKIWEKMLSDRLPLSDDVDIDRLAAERLTGGEIKNVLLNAARLALCRSPEGKISMKDFLRAAEMEKSGKWGESKKFGFSRE